MEYTDIRFKFSDEDSAIAALPEYRTTDQQGNPIWQTNGDGYAIDIIGDLFDIIPNPDDPMNPTVEQIPGYFINLRTWDGRENPAPNETVVPLNPRRVWA
jgi:hypothetical protein